METERSPPDQAEQPPTAQDDTTESSPLTLELIKAETGTQALDLLQKLEIIFSPVSEVDNLSQCRNLLELSLIETGLVRISNLDPVGHSLHCLRLSGNFISKIENLHSLVHLRELFLDNNKIRKIEGLDHCGQLRRLWLFSNQIERIENLHPSTQLRELSLQDNQIHSIEHLSGLVTLQSLALEGNPISSLTQITHLNQLPVLRQLSFQSEHFEASPVALIEGYRNYVISELAHLSSLDGLLVLASERRQVADDYLANVLAFNDEIDSLRTDLRLKKVALSAQQVHSSNQFDATVSRLSADLTQLQNLMEDSRLTVLQEQERIKATRIARRHELEHELLALQQAFDSEVEKFIREQEDKMQEEEEALNQMRFRLELEESIVSSLLDAQQVLAGSFIFYSISEQTSEFRNLQELLCPQKAPASPRRSVDPTVNLSASSAVRSTSGSLLSTPFRIHRAFRLLYNDRPSFDASETVSTVFIAPVTEIIAAMHSGFENYNCIITRQSVPLAELSCILVCLVNLGRHLQITSSEIPTQGSISTDKFPDVDTVSWTCHNTTYLVVFNWKVIRPETCVIVDKPNPKELASDRVSADLTYDAESILTSRPLTVERTVGGLVLFPKLSRPMPSSLMNIEKEAESILQKYELQLLEDLRSDASQKLLEQDKELKRVQESLDRVGRQLKAERQSQQSLLRDLKRSSVGAVTKVNQPDRQPDRQPEKQPTIISHERKVPAIDVQGVVLNRTGFNGSKNVQPSRPDSAAAVTSARYRSESPFSPLFNRISDVSPLKSDATPMVGRVRPKSGVPRTVTHKHLVRPSTGNRWSQMKR
eukprot:GILJ01008201.1.p1 GENE.GILJ01008201.1~~GILJ01008201.1.p1  ORF type:complete len:822 (-),score=119.95 GILJ01008201.1:424-2889(-)